MHHNMARDFPRCGWPLPHRDKHNCGCQCRLHKDHDGRHACEVALSQADAHDSALASAISGNPEDYSYLDSEDE